MSDDLTSSPLSIEEWPINQPIPYARNARKIPQSAIDKVAASIHEFGFRQPIVVDKQRVILAGHTRLLAAQKLGLNHVPVHVAMNLTVAQAKAFRLADNRTNQESAWDNDLLALELADLKVDDFGLELTGFDPDELIALDAAANSTTEGLTEDDAVPKPPKDPITVLGDLWTLGNHRLLCGDSTSKENVARLINGQRCELCFTSPPYADQRQYNGGKELATQHLAMFISASHDQVSYFAVNLGIARQNGEVMRYWDDYIDTAQSCGLKLLSWNIWDRVYPASIAQQTAMFPIEHEWVFVFGEHPKELNHTVANKHGGSVVASSTNRQTDGTLKRQGRRVCADSRAIGTIVVCDIHRGNSPHPAMFPVALPEAYIEAITEAGNLVYEPFGGSGSTLIACEKTARSARLMELDPQYCDVIVTRWQDFTGKSAVLEANGRTFNELAAERQPNAPKPEANQPSKRQAA